MFQPAAQLIEKDPLLANLDTSYAKPASQASIERAAKALEEKKHGVTIVDTNAEALEAIKRLIPSGSSVHNGASTTLLEIGFTEYFKDQKSWRNLHSEILAEPDHAKQENLRRTLGAAPDYYLTSVCAITEAGELMVVDWSGSRVGPIAHGAGHVVFVTGANKIVETLADAKKRTEEYCLPLESARVRIAYAAYGLKGSCINNSLTIAGFNPMATPGRYHFIIIKEASGF